MPKSLSDDPIAKLLSPEGPKSPKERKKRVSKLARRKFVARNPKSGLAGTTIGQYETHVHLTEMQELFCAAYGRDGANPVTAMRMAGYAGVPRDLDDRARQMLKDSRIQARIANYHAETRQASGLTRQDVIDGFKDAIEVGKAKGEGITMVAGWREIGRLCGFYEPVKHKIEINHTGEVLMKHIQGMSDAQLLEALREANGNEALDGQFSVLNGPGGKSLDDKS